MNSPLLTLATLVAFIALCWYSYPTQGYSAGDRAAMDRLVASAMPASLKERQQAAIAEVWGLTSEDVAKPVVLW